jgi:hypothetical protein
MDKPDRRIKLEDFGLGNPPLLNHPHNCPIYFDLIENEKGIA